jgi:opacity protein-like surface antigen
MKKIISLMLGVAAMVVCCTHPAEAQMPLGDGFPRLNGGFRAGINIANAALDPDFSQNSPQTTHSSKLGAVVGGALEYQFDPMVAVGFEMQYAQRGVIVDYVDFRGGGPATGTIRLDYLEFPVLLKLKLGDPPFRGILFAGPNFGFNLVAQGTYKYSDTSEGGSNFTADMDDYFQRADIGIDFGAGLEYNLNPSVFIIGDVRYTYGLTDATQEVPRGTEIWNTRDIRAMVGVMFHLWTARQ